MVKQLYNKYHNLDKEITTLFNDYVNKINNILEINEEVYLDYLVELLGVYKECILKSIDNKGNINVDDLELGKIITITLNCFNLHDKLQILDSLITQFKIN